MAQELQQQLREEGNALFKRGAYREALGKYAAAVAAAQSAKDSRLEATLRSNRSLCCLKIGDKDQALAEAEKAKELRPDWAKAHCRIAFALDALGELGSARLALLVARRLAPEDAEVASALSSLRSRIFPGPAAPIGSALDALEDFQAGPDAARDAAAQLCELLLAESEEFDADASDVHASCIAAFIVGKGADTVFRRQNAMGEHWQEEARNGTMSMLSRLSKAAPQLEEELVKLNQEAAAKEGAGACADGVPGCAPAATSGAATSSLPKGVPAAPPMAVGESRRKRGARPLGQACDFGGGESEDTAPDQEVVKSSAICETDAQPVGSPDAAVSTNTTDQYKFTLDKFKKKGLDPALCSASGTDEVSVRKATTTTEGDLAELSVASGKGTAITIDKVEDAALAALNDGWPGLSSMLPAGCSRSGHLVKCLQSDTYCCAPAIDKALAPWSFAIEVKRGSRRLWLAAIESSHALPGLLARPASIASVPLGPTVYERVDVIASGDNRRTAVAGVIAALAAAREAAEAGGDDDDDERVVAARAAVAEIKASVVAVNSASGRAVRLPAWPLPGSRRKLDKPAMPEIGSNSHLLQVVVGLGAQQILPGPKAMYPPGSLEVRTGLAFIGPQGTWLHAGGSADGTLAGPTLALAAFLQAGEAWSEM